MAKKAVNPAPKQDQKSLEQALSKSEQFFENNKKTIFGCLIAIIVIIAGGMLYNAKVVQPRELKASEAIFPGELKYSLITGYYYANSAATNIFSILFSCGFVFLGVLAIIGIVNAATGKKNKLLLVGQIPWVEMLMDKIYDALNK